MIKSRLTLVFVLSHPFLFFTPANTNPVQTSVGFGFAPLAEMMERYPPSEMREGFNDNGEETVFFVSNPALGLWAVRERLMREGGGEKEGGGVGGNLGGVDGEEKAVVEGGAMEEKG